MKTKVLHLISGGDTGGAKTHVFSLMKYLKEQIEVKIICFIDDTFYHEALALGLPIELVKQKSRTDLSVIKRLEEEINSANYDIVHCHGARANFIGYFLKRKVKLPFVTTIHSDYRLDFKGSFYKQLIYKTLNTMALKKFDYYIAVSDEFKAMMKQRGFGKDNIYVIYNGIDTEEEFACVSEEEFFKRYDIEPKEKIIFCLAARLDQVKNVETFIMAANKFCENREDALFLIGGNGPEREELETLAKDNKAIHFLDFVQDPFSLFNASDVNVLTSLSESFPYVILEAGMMKKPTISTDVGGVKKIIKPGETGFLFDVKDVDALTDYFIKLADDRSLSKQMGNNLYQLIFSRFNAREMANQHVSIYEEILHNQSR